MRKNRISFFLLVKIALPFTPLGFSIHPTPPLAFAMRLQCAMRSILLGPFYTNFTRSISIQRKKTRSHHQGIDDIGTL